MVALTQWPRRKHWRTTRPLHGAIVRTLTQIHLSDAGIKALRPGQQLDGVDEAATELQAFAAEMKRALSSF